MQLFTVKKRKEKKKQKDRGENWLSLSSTYGASAEITTGKTHNISLMPNPTKKKIVLTGLIFNLV